MSRCLSCVIWLTLSMLLLGNGTSRAAEEQVRRTSGVRSLNHAPDSVAVPASNRSDLASARKTAGDSGFRFTSVGYVPIPRPPVLVSIDRLEHSPVDRWSSCATNWRLPLRI
jgi:hypothetical protein